jgi:hypothetical protein
MAPLAVVDAMYSKIALLAAARVGMRYGYTRSSLRLGKRYRRMHCSSSCRLGSAAATSENTISALTE